MNTHQAARWLGISAEEFKAMPPEDQQLTLRSAEGEAAWRRDRARDLQPSLSARVNRAGCAELEEEAIAAAREAILSKTTRELKDLVRLSHRLAHAQLEVIQ